MSDDEERQTNFNPNSLNEINNRRLNVIKSKLQELTREKTKYNVEKLTQDAEFLHSEIGHLSHAIGELNKEINVQTNIRRNLNAQMAILRSNSGLRYTSLELAIQDKARYQKELEKPNKNSVYRDLAQRKVDAIIAALPLIQQQDGINQRLQEAEDRQTAARNKREKLVDSLNSKTRKQTEIKQLLNDSTTRLPELEAAIENLRLERDQISSSISGKKQRRRITATQQKSADSPGQSFASLEQDTLEYEKRHHNEQLEKIRLLLKYFCEKMSEHHLSNYDTPASTPTSELVSPLYPPITPFEEQTILSSFMGKQEDDNNLLIKTTTTSNEPPIAIAMKLPRNFTPLDIHSTTTNEIIHSPYQPDNSCEYKKELPSDIVDKYAGAGKKKQQQQQQQAIHGKKNKKNKKHFGIKHSSQMIVLYNDVRASTGDSDALPYMPMFEFELPPTVKALRLMEQSVESYLNELSQRYLDHLSLPLDEQRSEIVEDDDVRDSALDTYSEASSLIEPTNFSQDFTSVIPQLINIPEARSSSSSDDKKTIVSSASPPSSHHSHSKVEHHPISTALLTTVEELPPLTIQIAQIERQVSDEGYRSIRNEQQQQQATGTQPLLTRSSSYDCTEKVDKWLSSTTPPLSVLMPDNQSDFQGTDIDIGEEILLKSTFPVPDD